jgi:cytochrome c553
MMRLFNHPAVPLVGALLLAVVGGSIATHILSPEAPEPPSRPYPQPASLPGWAQQTIVANAQDGEPIFTQGVGGAVSCATCHGAAGIPERQAPYPRLAGLSAEYVAKQLQDYAEGVRNNEQMTPIARALNGQQRASVARYVATLKPPETSLSAASLDMRGRELDEVGDNAHAIPGCGNCHGLRGRGEGVMLPPLAGQPQAYLISQLNAFRAQRRRNDTVEVMEGIASRLTPQDIEAVARYYSSLAPVAAR